MVSWKLMELTRLRPKLRAALALSRRDRWALCQVWVTLLAVDLGLRLLPLRRLQPLLVRADVGAADATNAGATIQRLVHLVDVARRHHLYPMRCLARSLVLRWLLGRQGIDVDLRFGVRREEIGLAAHAWLEYGGHPIGEPEGIEASFAPLAAPEASG